MSEFLSAKARNGLYVACFLGLAYPGAYLALRGNGKLNFCNDREVRVLNPVSAAVLTFIYRPVIRLDEKWTGEDVYFNGD